MSDRKNKPSKRIELVSLRMVREKTSILYPNHTVQSPKQAADLFRQFFGYDESDREKFAVMYLDTKNQPNALEIISIGTLNASLVHPREVFKGALLVNAASIICVHSHPSGDPTPSSEDIAITDRLVKSGQILGLDVLDHLVLGDGTFISLKEQGLM